MPVFSMSILNAHKYMYSTVSCIDNVMAVRNKEDKTSAELKQGRSDSGSLSVPAPGRTGEPVL